MSSLTQRVFCRFMELSVRAFLFFEDLRVLMCEFPIVTNCLDWARKRTIVIGRDNVPEHVTRNQIAEAIIRRFQ